MDKWNLKRGPALAIVSAPAFLIGLVYVTKGGLYWLDIVDKFVNLRLIAAVVECIIGGCVAPTKFASIHNASQK